MIKPETASLVSIALLTELQSASGPDANAFLLATGERIGAACVFDFTGGLEGLTATMNDVWDELGWGQASLTLSGRQMYIRHQLPYSAHTAEAWNNALPPIVEGIYRKWFYHLDPQGVLTRRSGAGSELEFVFSE